MLNIEDPPLLWAEDLYCTLKRQPKGAGECLLLIAYKDSNDIGACCIFWPPRHILQHSAAKHGIIGPPRQLML